MKKLLLYAALLLTTSQSYASLKTDSVKQKYPVLVNIPGYVTLKCDFHLHTVFSDAHVWPTFRVREADRDGLDAISLTEHFDFEGFPEDLKRNGNRSYDIATEFAKNTNVLIIKGLEISPRVSPYHHNALFVQDPNKLKYDYMKTIHKQFVMKDNIERSTLMSPFLEVAKQGAFVFYNHPGYAWWDKKNRELFTEFHKELLDKKILGGVEVVNSGRYNVIGHEIAMKYNLTMMANSDEHFDISNSYKNIHRPMTLVLAKEKSVESIKEALLARRTIVFYNNTFIGRKSELEPFFKSAVTVSSEYKDRNEEKIVVVTLQNNTDVPYKLKLSSSKYMIEEYPMGRVTLNAKEQLKIIVKAVWDMPSELTVDCKVENIFTGVQEELSTSLALKPSPIKTN
ncbi:MAG: phosphotransferase [Pedobacter sp.]|nr:MAG: phosphotransferase [Pedobacter sp.]